MNDELLWKSFWETVQQENIPINNTPETVWIIDAVEFDPYPVQKAFHRFHNFTTKII